MSIFQLLISLATALSLINYSTIDQIDDDSSSVCSTGYTIIEARDLQGGRKEENQQTICQCSAVNVKLKYT